MATRGRKPKPDHLKLVLGNPGKRPLTDETLARNHDADLVDLERPKFLKGRAANLWDETLPLLWWLGDVDGHKLGMWCALQAEFERSPKQMIAGRIAQLRALGSELGMDPASRARVGGTGGDKKDKKSKASGFFE